MKFVIVALVLCACVWTAAGDVAHIKAAKSKVLGRLLKEKHHKRGILTAIPPFKLGHDIPHVTHSLVKPLVVTYPPTATVAAVKVPLTNPHLPHYPVPVGHKVPVPHPHYGLKFPHTKFLLQKPDHHFHHHHHHVAPKPVVPVVPLPPPVPVAPVAPLPQPTIAQPVPAPSPPVFIQPNPIIPAPPVPVSPAPIFHAHPGHFGPAPVLQSHPVPLAPPPVHVLPPNHLHLKPLLPAETVPLAHPQLLSAPALPQLPYVIRPGGSVQTSLFATFPRYPLVNYQHLQQPFIPLAPSLSAGQTVQQVLFDRPQVPQYHFIPQAFGHNGVFEQHTPNVAVEPTPNVLHPNNVSPSVIPLNPPHELPQHGVHLHPTQAAFPQPEFHLHSTQTTAVHLQPTQPSIPLDHDGWSPVPPQPTDAGSAQSPEAQYPQQGHQFTQEQGTQVYEHHSGDQYHDYQNQLQHHIQQQIEQAQYEQHLNNQHQLNQEYGAPQQVGQDYAQPSDYFQQNQEYANHNYAQQAHDFSQQGHDFPQQGHDFSQQGHDFSQQGHDFSQQGHDFSQQGHDFSQQGNDFSQQGQDFSQQGQDFSQQGQDFSQNDYNLAQPGQEYGLPQQGVEGRSADDQTQQQFHNHIPLGLQPPIDRPLEHFR